ncbi:MAG: hypothetical protein ACR2LL_06450 [Nitrosopumilus sp.]
MEITHDEIVEITETPYQLFEKSVPNKETWRFYRNMMKRVLCGYLKNILTGDPKLVEKQKQEMTEKNQKLHYRKDYYDADYQVRINEIVQRAKDNPKWIDSVLITLASKLMDRTKLPKIDPDYIKSTMVENNFKPLKKLFSMTDVPIAWGKIDSLISDENDIQDKSRGYTVDELELICKFCDPMERVMVKLGASSGIRAGAHDLDWGHIFKVYQIEDGKYVWEPEEITESIEKKFPVMCGLIRVYADSNAEYIGLVTPEWLNDLEIYKQRWIKETNHLPRPNDPLFKRAGPLIKRMSYGGFRKRMERVVEDSGIRVHLEDCKGKFNVPLFNGSRRFFNKQNKKAFSKNSKLAALIIKEYQMGHGGLIKLDKNYFKEQVEELIDEYILAIPLLTVDGKARKQAELEKERIKKDELEIKVNEIEELKQQRIDDKKDIQKMILETLKKQGIIID